MVPRGQSAWLTDPGTLERRRRVNSPGAAPS